MISDLDLGYNLPVFEEFHMIDDVDVELVADEKLFDIIFNGYVIDSVCFRELLTYCKSENLQMRPTDFCNKGLVTGYILGGDPNKTAQRQNQKTINQFMRLN